MRKLRLFSIFILALFLILTASIQITRAEGWLENQKVLKSASELDYPPFAIIQPDGTAGGFSVDLLKAATEAVGLSITFTVGPWNELKQHLADKVLDVLPLVSYSEERDKVYDFSTAYLRMNGTIFVRKSNTDIKSLSDLKNKEVLVMQGDTAHEYALREKLSDVLITKATYEEAFKILSSGKHDAIVVQQIVGLQIIKKLNLNNIVPVQQKNISSLKPMALRLDGFEQKFCFAVPEGNHQLLALLNEGLAIISLNGTYNALYEKWFAPILPKPQVPFSETIKQLFSILVPLLLLITLVGLWYLKRMVAKRTQYLELEIQQRKRVEKELLESHDLLANLARLVPGVVYQYRLYPDGRSAFPYASPGMNDMYEVPPKEVLEDAASVFTLLHPDDYEKVVASIQESARTLQTFHCEFRVILPRQGLRWRWSQAQPERMEDGGTLWHGIILDITERKEAEDQLINLSQRLQLATSSALLGVWDWNVRDNTMIWNDRMFELYGITQDTFSSNILAWMNSLHPEDKDNAIAEYQAALKGNKEFNSVFRILHPDGAVRYLKANGLVLRDVDGTAVRMLGINVDITEQKNAENALKSNITKLEVLLGITSLPEANLKTISDHILSSITKLMESEYGFYGFVSEDESIMSIHSWSGEAMENCAMVDKPRDFAICKSGVWAEAVRRREPLILNNYAADHPAKGGLPAGHVQLTNLLVLPFFSHGRITAVAAVANRSNDYSQDDVAQLTAFLTSVQAITDSKRAEEELRKSEGHLRTLVETIPDLIWLKDIDGMYLSCNPIFERFFGAKVADIIGKTDYDFLDRELADFFVENDCKARLAGKPTTNEEWITFADGGHRVLLETIKTPMYDSQGTLIGVLGIGRDITERRRSEEENAQLQVQLQQAQKMEAVGTLAGGIAHDFNNILGAILGYAEMVQDDSPAGSTVRKDIDQVVKASHRAKDLVKQILTFSRQAAADHVPLQPGVIIKEALKMLRSSLPTTIDIQHDIDPGAGLILADPTQIHQVIVNLCTNAFHAMEETGGILNISLKKKTLSRDDIANEPRVQPGDFVQLSISDTGLGIAPEIQDKMFDPYFTTKEVGKGTGMGLAIIHGIVKSYNGFVTCHSQLGEGTIFKVYLPVIADPAVIEVETLPVEFTQLGNERILFIDDEEILAEMGKTMLERLGYRVTVKRNSIEALNTFQKQPDKFDLVITDQTMPGMTGSDLALRMLQIRPGLPIILCTGYSSLISEKKARALGIKGFAIKPLAKKDISALIRMVLDGKKISS